MAKDRPEASVGLIYTAILAIMEDMDAITKDRRSEQGYKFRGIDDALVALKPVLVKHGVFILPEVLDSVREIGQTKSGSKQVYSVLKVQFTLCAQDGSSVKCVMIGEGQDTGDKSSGKAHSTAFKSMVWEVFCVPTEDAEQDVEAPAARPKSGSQNSLEPRVHGESTPGPKPTAGVVKPTPSSPRPSTAPTSVGQPSTHTPVPSSTVASLPSRSATSAPAAAKASAKTAEIEEAGVRGVPLVSIPHLKAFMGIVKERGWKNKEVADYIKAMFRVDQAAQLTTHQFSALQSVVRSVTFAQAMDEVNEMRKAGQLP